MFWSTVLRDMMKIAIKNNLTLDINMWSQSQEHTQVSYPAPRWGGADSAPHLEYSQKLKNYVRYRHQTFSTLLDINLTPCLKILSNLVGKFLRKWRFSDVMSCDFELKMVIRYIDRRLMYAEANRKQKVSKQRKLNSLQDGYLGFSNILDFGT